MQPETFIIGFLCGTVFAASFSFTNYVLKKFVFRKRETKDTFGCHYD